MQRKRVEQALVRRQEGGSLAIHALPEKACEERFSQAKRSESVIWHAQFGVTPDE